MDATLYEKLKDELLKYCSAEQLLDLERNTKAALAQRSSEAAIAARSQEITACPHAVLRVLLCGTGATPRAGSGSIAAKRPADAGGPSMR